MLTAKIDDGLLTKLLRHVNRYDVSTVILVHHGLKNGGMIYIESSNQSELEAILKELELHPEPFKRERQTYYFIWHDNSFVPETRKAKQAMYIDLVAYNKTQIGARFSGIPKCCNDALGEKSYERYRRQLSRLFKAKGIKAITPFVGIKHAPCSIDCKPTLNLGYLYSLFLRRNYPNIYLVELNILRKDMVKL